MASPHAISALPLAAASLLVAWRLAARVRRLIGRQPLRLWRVRLSAGLLPVALLVLLATAFAHPPNALALASGIALGIAAAGHSLRTTRWEAGPAGWFYTPNPYVGVVLFALLCARLGYRLIEAYARGGSFAPPADLFRSAPTLLIVGLLLAHYATYAWGLLRWRARTSGAATGSGGT